MTFYKAVIARLDVGCVYIANLEIKYINLPAIFYSAFITIQLIPARQHKSEKYSMDSIITCKYTKTKHKGTFDVNTIHRSAGKSILFKREPFSVFTEPFSATSSML